MKLKQRYVTTVIALIAVLVPMSNGGPLGNAFTYQGRLTQNGQPANGAFDMGFSLWDAQSGGNQIGSTVGLGTMVTNGLFTVQLNQNGEFGTNAFNGQARWLQINVNGSPLAPRQPLTPAPYALYALNSGGGGGGYWAPNGVDIYNTNTGRVGIGTTTPLAALHYSGDVITPAHYSSVYEDDLLAVDADAVLGLYSNASGVRGSNVCLAEIDAEGDLIDKWALGRNTSGSGSALYFKYGTNANYASNATKFVLEPGGNVYVSGNGNFGVGTSSPTARVTAYGLDDGQSNNLGVGVYGSTSDPDGYGGLFAGPGAFGSGPALWSAGDTLLSGTVRALTLVGIGIGSGSPSARLHVNGDGEQVAQFTQFGSDPCVSISLANANSNYSALSIYSSSANAPALAVNGTASVDVLEIYGADLAEKFPISEPDAPEPGTVMEIDPVHPGKLRIARGTYNRRVAGVISGAADIPTGTIMGNLPGHEDAPPIALSGRVWVRCDASEQAIAPGDLLTTSSTPGHAMKARDHARSHGATIGKAMSNLAQGEQGMVLVLIALQ